MLGLGAPIFAGSSFWNYADFLMIRYSENSSGIEFPASRGVFTTKTFAKRLSTSFALRSRKHHYKNKVCG